MARKNEYYRINITYNDARIEEAKYREGIDTRNWNKMISEYKRIKELLKNKKDVAFIDFIGIGFNGEIEVIFTKEITKIIDNEQATRLDLDCREVTKDIYDLLGILNMQLNHYKNIFGKSVKERNNLLHEIELSDNIEFKTLDEKIQYQINTFNRQKRVEESRRKAKQNIRDLEEIHQYINIEGIMRALKPYKEDRDLNGCDKQTPNEFIRKNTLEVKYKNNIERVKLIKKHKSNFDECREDEVSKSLFFYNRVGEGKLKTKHKNRRIK